MTQLDRLEALANESVTWGLSPKHMELWTAFPDLIRVARAADALRNAYTEPAGVKVSVWRENFTSLADALAPLFAEVES